MISLNNWGLEKMQRFLNTNERQAYRLRELRASQGVCLPRSGNLAVKKQSVDMIALVIRRPSDHLYYSKKPNG